MNFSSFFRQMTLKSSVWMFDFFFFPLCVPSTAFRQLQSSTATHNDRYCRSPFEVGWTQKSSWAIFINPPTRTCPEGVPRYHRPRKRTSNSLTSPPCCLEGNQRLIYTLPPKDSYYLFPRKILRIWGSLNRALFLRSYRHTFYKLLGWTMLFTIGDMSR